MSDTATSSTTGKTGSSSELRDLHFDLRWLGEEHLTGSYTLRAAGGTYPLERHTAESLSADGLDDDDPATRPTHVARTVSSKPDVVGLLRVYGPPDANGIPTLVSMAIATSGPTPSYSVDHLAHAIVFLNPGVSVLTPTAADTVLGHIAAADGLSELTLALTAMGPQWNVPQPLVDATGQHRDGAAAGGQRTPVGGLVDADGRARDDRVARARHHGGDLAGGRGAVAGRRP